MIGLVLCGGKSLRMGNDKGLLLTNGKSWANIAASKLKSLNILSVKFSVNASQEPIYNNIFKKEDLITDNENLNIGGPLKGILSAHLSAPAEDIFVLACDLLNMETDLMRKLIDAKNNNDIYEAYLFSHPNFYEPLCGIYSAKGLAKIIKLYNDGNLNNHSLQFAIAKLKTCDLSLLEQDQTYFKNFNSSAEMDEL